jgi:hypothetical protein
MSFAEIVPNFVWAHPDVVFSGHAISSWVGVEILNRARRRYPNRRDLVLPNPGRRVLASIEARGAFYVE